MAFNIDTAEGAALNQNNQRQRVEIISDPITQEESQETDKHRKQFCIISSGLVLVALIQIICIIFAIIGYNKLSDQCNSTQTYVDDQQELQEENNANSEFFQKQIDDACQHFQTQIDQINILLGDIQNHSVIINLTRTMEQLQSEHDLSIVQLQGEIDSISIENTNLNNEIGTVQTDFDSKYATLQNTDNSLQTQIDSIGTDITNLNAQIVNVQNDLNGKNTALQSVDSSLQSQINSLSVGITDINSQIIVMNTNPTQLTSDIVTGSSWYFYNQYGLITAITLEANGVISGFNDANVQTWRLSAAGILEFYNPSNTLSIEFIFTVLGKNGKWNLLGPIYATDIHYLQQI